MRENALGVLSQVKRNGFAYIFYKSKPQAVILDIDDFISLHEALEDQLDTQEAKKLSREARGTGIAIEDVEQYV